MTDKFQIGDTVFTCSDHFQAAGTVCGTINKCAANDELLYKVQDESGDAHTIPESELIGADDARSTWDKKFTA